MRTSKAQTKKREQAKKALLEKEEAEKEQKGQSASESRKDDSDRAMKEAAKRLLSEFKNAGWRVKDESGVLMRLVPEKSDFDSAILEFDRIRHETGYVRSCGIRRETKNDAKSADTEAVLEENEEEEE